MWQGTKNFIWSEKMQEKCSLIDLMYDFEERSCFNVGFAFGESPNLTREDFLFVLSCYKEENHFWAFLDGFYYGKMQKELGV